MRPLIRSCFLLPLLGRLFLLALPVLLGICLPSRWSPPFPLHTSALIPLFFAKMRLSPILILSSLMIWYFGQTALFLFVLVRAAPAFLPTALSVALRLLFPFRQAQHAQVIPLKPAPFCTLFGGLGSTNKSVISFPRRTGRASKKSLPRRGRRKHERMSGRKSSPGQSAVSWFHSKSGQS